MTSYIDVVAHRYIFKKQKPMIPLKLKLLLDTSPEVRELMRRQCPWCGKKFKSRHALLRHLSPNGYALHRRTRGCVFMYMQLLTRITNMYKILRFDIVFKAYSRTRKYYVRSVGHYFRTLEEAFEEWLRCTTS